MGDYHSLDMSREPPQRKDHFAVRIGSDIWLTGGTRKRASKKSFNEIWVYEISKHRWQVHIIDESKEKDKSEEEESSNIPHNRHGPSAVAIEKEIYMFGGSIFGTKGKDGETNEVWRLSKSETDEFKWKNLPASNQPAPRHDHTAWAYNSHMWVFGGFVEENIADFPRLNSDTFLSDGPTDQLLCFNPFDERWECVESSGAKPCPRHRHATAHHHNKAWVFGGNGGSNIGNHAQNATFSSHLDVYELNLDSMIWTIIQAAPPVQSVSIMIDRNNYRRKNFSLTAISKDKLVLHGGAFDASTVPCNDTWVFQPPLCGCPSWEWINYPCTSAPPRQSHTATLVATNELVIIGGLQVDSQSTKDFVRHLSVRDWNFWYVTERMHRSLERMGCRRSRHRCWNIFRWLLVCLCLLCIAGSLYAGYHLVH